MGSKKLIRVFKDKKGKDLPQPTLGLALMQTSKQMYAETRPFFYRNSFDLTEMTKRTWGTLIPDLRNTLRRVSLLWQTRYGAERNTFLMLQRFENLKELDLIISKKCAYYAHYYGGNQHLYQDNKSIGKFSKVYGFDQLVGLRGLDKVTVLNDKGKHNAPPIFVTHAEIEALQTFLQGILKEPKPIPEVAVPVSSLVPFCSWTLRLLTSESRWFRPRFRSHSSRLQRCRRQRRPERRRTREISGRMTRSTRDEDAGGRLIAQHTEEESYWFCLSCLLLLLHIPRSHGRDVVYRGLCRYFEKFHGIP